MIDLNADVGEGAGHDEEIFACITSANIACGGHAGDERTMEEAVRRAVRFGVRVGAHPGFEGKEDFGRTEREAGAAEVKARVVRQVKALQRVADVVGQGASVTHVKPHGALYNQAAKDASLARAVAEAVREIDPALILYALAGSALEAAGRGAGLTVMREGFADRRYRADGSLVPRSEGKAAALIEDLDEAVAQAVRMARGGAIDTICLHGDSPRAAELARRVKQAIGVWLPKGA